MRDNNNLLEHYQNSMQKDIGLEHMIFQCGISTNPKIINKYVCGDPMLSMLLIHMVAKVVIFVPSKDIERLEPTLVENGDQLKLEKKMVTGDASSLALEFKAQSNSGKKNYIFISPQTLNLI